METLKEGHKFNAIPDLLPFSPNDFWGPEKNALEFYPIF